MITISAGHYGPKTGAHGLIDEGTENIKVGKRLTEILRSANVVTSYIQDTVNKSANTNVNWLVAEHNKTSRELDVQIHFNSSVGTHSKGIGVEVLVYGDSMVNFAKRVSKAIAQASGLIDRGAKIRKDLGFLKNTKKPAILIEVCFVNDSVDVALYKRDFEKICQAIASELAKAVGKVVKPTNTNQTTNKKDDVSYWAKGAHEWVVANNISDGKRPQDNVTRQEIWSMLQRMHNTLIQ